MLDRRAFLRAVVAAGGAGALASGCSRAGTRSRPPSRSSGPSSTAGGGAHSAATSATPGGTPGQGPARPPRPADWAALGRGLAGRLVLPGDRDYDTVRLLADPRFDRVRPAGIAVCAAPADVQECLGFARHHRVPLATRGGGHSYAGWSTGPGLVVDVTGMRAVHADTGSGTALVGAGARLIDVYAGLAAAGVTVPAGSCPTVGIAGLTLGGGIGVVSRAYGLTSDNLVGAQVVTAAGRVLDCDRRRFPDLFWACRGGGGGNFGVVTSFRFRTRPAPDLTLFYLAWPWRQASRVVEAWQHWAPDAPDRLWSTCKLLAGGNRAEPTALASGTFLGSQGELQPLLDMLVARVGADPSGSSVRTQPYLAAMLAEAGCAERTVAQCHLPWQTPGGQRARVAQAAASHFVDTPVPATGLATMVRAVAARGLLPGGGEGGIALDALGGAINRVPPQATAFVHRSGLFLAQLTTTWQNGASAGTVGRHREWLRGFRASLSRYASGEAYQNYVDPELSGWRRAYYGANYERLVRVKAAYDPGSLFRLPQAVPGR